MVFMSAKQIGCEEARRKMNERVIFGMGLIVGYLLMYLLYNIINLLNEMIEEQREIKFLKWLHEKRAVDIYYNLEKQKLDYLAWKEGR